MIPKSERYRRFQTYTRSVYQQQGYAIRDAGPDEMGVDFWMNSPDQQQQMAVRCLPVQGMVFTATLLGFFGAYADRDARGILVTTGTVHPLQRAWADAHRLQIVDRDAMATWPPQPRPPATLRVLLTGVLSGVAIAVGLTLLWQRWAHIAPQAHYLTGAAIALLALLGSVNIVFFMTQRGRAPYWKRRSRRHLSLLSRTPT